MNINDVYIHELLWEGYCVKTLSKSFTRSCSERSMLCCMHFSP